MLNSDHISRVVVLSPNWLGDAAMSLPALADIRRHFADAKLAVAARTGVAPLFGSAPGVDEVIMLADGGGALKRRRSDVDALTAGQFDLAILLPNSFSSAWIVKQAGIRERWGYRANLRRILLTRAVRRPRPTMHLGEYYQHLLRELGVATGVLRPHLVVSERDNETGSTLLAREGWTPSTQLVGLAPGAAYGFAKQWPPDRFAALARLLAEQGISSVLVGRPADQGVGRRVMTAFEGAAAVTSGAQPAASSRRPAGRLLNLVGRTTVRQLMGLMTQCGTFVANDSGAAHLAAAIGLPVVAIFGPTDERITRPLSGQSFTGSHIVLSHPVFCRPCMLSECPIDHRCMTRIEPTRVFDAVMQQLAQRVVPAQPAGAARGVGVPAIQTMSGAS